MKNIYRIIFWGFIMLICISLGVMGVVRSNLLFSNRRTQLNYIVDNFNNNSLLKSYRLSDVIITAKLKGKDIVVTYEADKRTKYKFILNNNYIETTYKKNDAFASVMVKLIADSISQYYGNAPQMSYKAFENSDLLKDYTLNEGILYIDNNDSYTVRLNLNKSIVIKYEENNNVNVDPHLIINDDDNEDNTLDNNDNQDDNNEDNTLDNNDNQEDNNSEEDNIIIDNPVENNTEN